MSSCDIAAGNKLYYYHFDGLGSVIALSDANSEIVERYSYDVFGEPNRTSDVNNPYLFTGRRYDPEAGLYYYRARYYDYYTGRFLQPDPIGYADGLNLYTYCGNNPIVRMDPYGLKAGDRYESSEEAAMAAMDDIYERSMSEGVEYGGWIYKRWRGGYCYTEPTRGTRDSFSPGRFKALRLERGIYHSHPQVPGYRSERFSTADRYTAHRFSLDLYVITPKGHQKKYDPDTGIETVWKRPQRKISK